MNYIHRGVMKFSVFGEQMITPTCGSSPIEGEEIRRKAFIVK
jgi:hypothetical protein